MSQPMILFLYATLVAMASVLGGLVPAFVKLSHRRMQTLLSAIAGFMLGIGLLHMLPHAAGALGSTSTAAQWMLAGFLAIFFLERFSPFHHHEVGEAEHLVVSPQEPSIRLTWSGAAVGLTLHSLLDGMALGAAVQSGTGPGMLAGFAVFLVIMGHRPLDSLTLLTLMTASGWSVRGRHLANGLFALTVPLGALLFSLATAFLVDNQTHLVGIAMAIASGTFVCIASSDLLPELQFHKHDRVRLCLALVVGIAFAVLISRFDAHDHDAGAAIRLPLGAHGASASKDGTQEHGIHVAPGE